MLCSVSNFKYFYWPFLYGNASGMISSYKSFKMLINYFHGMFSPSSLKIFHCLYNWYDEYVLFNTQYIYLKDFISKVDIRYQQKK